MSKIAGNIVVAIAVALLIAGCRSPKSNAGSSHVVKVLVLGAVKNMAELSIDPSKVVSVNDVIGLAGGVDHAMEEEFNTIKQVYVTKRRSGIRYRIGKEDWQKPLDFGFENGDKIEVPF